MLTHHTSPVTSAPSLPEPAPHPSNEREQRGSRRDDQPSRIDAHAGEVGHRAVGLRGGGHAIDGDGGCVVRPFPPGGLEQPDARGVGAEVDLGAISAEVDREVGAPRRGGRA